MNLLLHWGVIWVRNMDWHWNGGLLDWLLLRCCLELLNWSNSPFVYFMRYQERKVFLQRTSLLSMDVCHSLASRITRSDGLKPKFNQIFVTHSPFSVLKFEYRYSSTVCFIYILGSMSLSSHSIIRIRNECTQWQWACTWYLSWTNHLRSWRPLFPWKVKT